jgi:hypothetical protein
MSQRSNIGLWVATFGVCGLVFFAFVFDTSVYAGNGIRVNNLGLMQDRQTGLIVSALIAALGVVIIFLPQKNESGSDLGTSTAPTNPSKSNWSKERNIGSDEYQIYLVKKYGIEKNEVLGKFIADGKSYESVADALAAAHAKDVESEAAHQEAINNDLSEPHPDTHVKCPDCKGLVRKEASKCRHCGCRLTPQR